MWLQPRKLETVQLHDVQIKAIIDVLQKMTEPPKLDAPNRRIGFQNPGDDNPKAKRKT